MNTRYIKVRNRHGFTTIATTRSSLDIFPEVPKNWEVANCDVDGEPWSWYREATEEEIIDWENSGIPFGTWMEE